MTAQREVAYFFKTDNRVVKICSVIQRQNILILILKIVFELKNLHIVVVN